MKKLRDSLSFNYAGAAQVNHKKPFVIFGNHRESSGDLRKSSGVRVIFGNYRKSSNDLWVSSEGIG